MEDSRWALGNESNEEIHVIDECVVVRAGKIFWLMFVGGRSIIVHVDKTLLHASDISQVLWQGLKIKGIFPTLRKRCEV